MAESDNLPSLLDQLRGQTFRNFRVYCCVNQPEGWLAGNAHQRAVAADNLRSLQLLREVDDLALTVLDRCSEGCGFGKKHHGVGQARKELFARILEDIGGEKGGGASDRGSSDGVSSLDRRGASDGGSSDRGNCSGASASDRGSSDGVSSSDRRGASGGGALGEELIVSLDGDTFFGPHYLEGVWATMNEHSEWGALCVPYYHPLGSQEEENRALLRYEMYMRHYEVQMLLAGCPYAFTALGSAMAFGAEAYRKAGGISPLQGGEDFYLMQKFCKTGLVGLWTEQRVEPQGRTSARVPFGTGPAIARGVEGMEESYPFYGAEAFEAVGATFAALPLLFERDVETPMSEFLRERLGTDDLWGPLRKNFHTRELFVRGCRERVDGLRVLQFLKCHHTAGDHFGTFCAAQGLEMPHNFSWTASPVEEIDALRQRLYALELRLRAQRGCCGV